MAHALAPQSDALGTGTFTPTSKVSGDSARHTSGVSISDTYASQQSSTDILATASVIRAGHSIAFLMRNVSLEGNARPQAVIQPTQDTLRSSGSRRTGDSEEGRYSRSDRTSSQSHGARDRLNSQDTARSTSSGRSSFALESVSPEMTGPSRSFMPSLDCTRPSMESFNALPPRVSLQIPESEGGPSAQDFISLCAKLNIQPAMQKSFAQLAAVARSLPVPMRMLALLWGLNDEVDAEATAIVLEERGVMRVACLADGTAWALVDPTHLQNLQVIAPVGPPLHNRLLERYKAAAGVTDVSAVPDDGYWLQAVGHHLKAAGRSAELQRLLCDPVWLEHKLHAYGVSSIVADFRRYLGAPEANIEVKMLLEAFQMSLSACLEHPGVPLLRSQMVGRLLAHATTPFLQSWISQQRRAVAAGATAAVGGPAGLMPVSASLSQAGGLQRMILRGHAAGITKILLSAAGVDVITGSTDGTVRIWDMEIGDCVLLLSGHSGAITDLAASPDGRLLVSTSADCTARVWELEKGQCTAILQGHKAIVNGVAVDSLGRFAVTVSADRSARVWNLATERCIHVMLGHGAGIGTGVLYAVAMTPNNQKAVTSSDDLTLRVWDLTSGTCDRVLSGHSGWVVDVKLLPCGERVVSASHDGTARVWDLASGKCIHVLAGHSGRVNTVTVSEDGATLITASDDSTARVWDANSGKCRTVLNGHDGWLTGATISHDGSQAVTTSGDGVALVWDLSSGKQLRVLEGHSAEVSASLMTHKARFVVTSSLDATARLWDLLAHSEQAITMHTGSVASISVSPDGITAASLGTDGCALLWDTSTGSLQGILEGHDAALRYGEILSDGRRLVTASGDRQISVWDLATRQILTTIQPVKGSRVKSVVASSDGTVAVLVLFDSSIGVWDLLAGNCRCMLQQRGVRQPSVGHVGGVNAVYLTPDGKRAVSVSKDCTARVWDLELGAPIFCLSGHSDNVVSAAISGDSTILATASDDCTARLWNLSNGCCQGVLTHAAPTTSVTLSGDGHLALVACADHTASLWDIATGAQICTLSGHKDAITGAAFDGSGYHVATCSRDSTVRYWSTITGELEGLFMADASLTCCAFAGAAKETVLLAGGDGGHVHLLDLPHN